MSQQLYLIAGKDPKTGETVAVGKDKFNELLANYQVERLDRLMPQYKHFKIPVYDTTESAKTRT